MLGECLFLASIVDIVRDNRTKSYTIVTQGFSYAVSDAVSDDAADEA